MRNPLDRLRAPLRTASVLALFALTASGGTCISANNEPVDEAVAKSDCDTQATGFAGGDGSAASPYQICSATQLAAIRGAELCSKSYVLTSDIDLKGVSWTALCIDPTLMTTDDVFTGSFDGNGKTISNLSMAGKPAALFGGISSGSRFENLTLARFHLTISDASFGVGGALFAIATPRDAVSPMKVTLRNVTVRDSSITGTVNGAVAGTVGGMFGIVALGAGPPVRNDSIVEGINVTNVTISGRASEPNISNGFYGGLFGDVVADDTAQLTLRDLHFSGTVAGGGGLVGGLVGAVVYRNAPGAANLLIEDSTVDLVGSSSTKIGGVVGWSYGLDLSKVTAQVDLVHVDDQESERGAGGLVGYSTAETGQGQSWTDVRVTGSIVSYRGDGVGGLVGVIEDENHSFVRASTAVDITGDAAAVGGLVGSARRSNRLNLAITDSAATGKVSTLALGALGAGGLIGDLASCPDSIALKRVFAAGVVFGVNSGGLIGNSSGGVCAIVPTVAGVFWDQDSTTQASSYGGWGTIKTQVQMQTAATFTGAGYVSLIWNIADGSYPTLK